MKKLLLIVICVLPSLYTYTQITIDEADMPNAGDTFLLSVGDPFTYQVDLNETGPNHAWDYSDLIPLKQKTKRYQLSILVSPLYGLIGPLSIATKIADSINAGPNTLYDVYYMYEQDELLYNVFQQTGRGLTYNGITAPTSYSDDDEIYFFPLEFGNVDTSTYAVNSDIPDFGTINTTGKRYTRVDGWGQVTTPFGTYDVLRVRSVVEQRDSIYITDIQATSIVYYRTFEIKFLSNDFRYPVLEFRGNLYGSIYDLNEINYLDEPRDIPALYKPAVDFSADVTHTSVGSPVTFTNLTNHWPQNQYEWTMIPSQVTWLNNTHSHSKDPVVSFNSPGLYHVKLEANNPFGTDQETKNYYINVDFNLGAESQEQPEVQAFPNPAGNIIRFTLNLAAATDLGIEIRDIHGRTVMTESWKGNPGTNLVELGIENLPGGIYSYRITGTEVGLEGKFVKE